MAMDHFHSAAFHRLHARDPQFEQRVLLDRQNVESVWSRWTAWTAGDPRRNVFILDTTELSLDATVSAAADWITSVRESGTALMRSSGWWA